MMKYVIDIVAILLMGDGLAKILSPKEHGRFYYAEWAPWLYKRLLNYQMARPTRGVVLGLGMLAAGALMSRWAEKHA